MKKLWISIGITSILTLTISLGVVYAQGDGDSDSGHVNDFVARVAEILGIEEEEVKDAFDQARKEMFESRLKEAVENGKLTQEEADEKLEWLDSNPGFGFHKGRMGKPCWGEGKFKDHKGISKKIDSSS